MRVHPSLLLWSALLLAQACGSSDDPGGAGATGGSGGTATGGVAGTDASLGGSAGSVAGAGGVAGTDASLGGSAGSDAGAGGVAGTDASTGGASGASTGGTGGVAPNPNFDCPTPNDAGTLGDAGVGVRLRVVAANLTSSNFQAYEDPGIRILQGLAPDVALVQEMNYLHGTLRDLVDTAFDPSFCFFRETQAGGIPNGIVSRYPIVAHGEWPDTSVPDRDFAWARIDVPGAVDLWAVSVHLKTTNAGVRASEAQALIGFVQSQVPAGDYLVIGGDLNTDSTGESALGVLSARVVTGGPRPVDQNDNDDTNQNRNKPYDWVLPSPGLSALEVPVQQGASSYPSGLVFDSRVYTPLSEVTPVQVGDSGAVSMQHMAVVKDFQLP